MVARDKVAVTMATAMARAPQTSWSRISRTLIVRAHPQGYCHDHEIHTKRRSHFKSTGWITNSDFAQLDLLLLSFFQLFVKKKKKENINKLLGR